MFALLRISKLIWFPNVKKDSKAGGFSVYSQTADDFHLGNFDINTQDADEVERPEKIVESISENYLITESSSRVNVQTLEKSISVEVIYEVESVVATVETGVHDVIWYAMDNLFIPRMELLLMPVLPRHVILAVLAVSRETRPEGFFRRCKWPTNNHFV